MNKGIFEIGDKVRVIQNLKKINLSCNPYMRALEGKIVTITWKSGCCYHIKQDGGVYYWTDSLFEVVLEGDNTGEWFKSITGVK